MQVNSNGQVTTPQTFKTRSNAPQEAPAPRYRGLEQDTVSFSAKLDRTSVIAEKTAKEAASKFKIWEILPEEGKQVTDKVSTVADEVIDVLDVVTYNGKTILAKIPNPDPVTPKMDPSLKNRIKDIEAFKKEHPDIYNQMIQKELNEQNNVLKQRIVYDKTGKPIKTNVGKNRQIPENKESVLSRTTNFLKQNLYNSYYSTNGRKGLSK